MVIKGIRECGYATDGGSIFLMMEVTEGEAHSFEAIQDLIPIRGWFVGKRNGDIFLDGRKITKDSVKLSEIRDAISGFLETDKRTEGIVELPPNTMVLGGDLQEYMRKDEVGRERLLLRWSITRIERALAKRRGR